MAVGRGTEAGGGQWLWLQRANRHWLGDELMCHFRTDVSHRKKMPRASGGACVDSCWPKTDWHFLKTTQSIRIEFLEDFWCKRDFTLNTAVWLATQI